MNKEHAGKRVRLVKCTDVHTRLRPGDCGTVMFTDSSGTVHIKWDVGSTLGMIPNEDVFEFVK